MRFPSVLLAIASLLGACDGRLGSVDREITLLSEVEYDAWHTRRQFPYELKYRAVTATYATDQPGEFIRFHCGPLGHMVRHVVISGAKVEELSLIRLETTKGKKLCRKVTARLHKLVEGSDGEGPLATLLLEDRHQSGKPHVASIGYKAQIVYHFPK